MQRSALRYQLHILLIASESSDELRLSIPGLDPNISKRDHVLEQYHSRIRLTDSIDPDPLYRHHRLMSEMAEDIAIPGLLLHICAEAHNLLAASGVQPTTLSEVLVGWFVVRPSV